MYSLLLFKHYYNKFSIILAIEKPNQTAYLM